MAFTSGGIQCGGAINPIAHFGGHRWRNNRRLRFESLEDRRLLSITVDTLVDENNGVGVGTGTSLREAIAAAAPGDTINFSVTGTINLSIGDSNSTKSLLIDKNLTIQGPGRDLLTIQAFDPTPTQKSGDGSRIFTIDDGNSATLLDVAISGLTLTGGDVTNGGGGEIKSSENLVVANCAIIGNNAASSSYLNAGGGIFSSATLANPNSLTIRSSTLSGKFDLVGRRRGSSALRTSYHRRLHHQQQHGPHRRRWYVGGRRQGVGHNQRQHF